MNESFERIIAADIDAAAAELRAAAEAGAPDEELQDKTLALYELECLLIEMTEDE